MASGQVGDEVTINFYLNNPDGSARPPYAVRG